MSYQLNIYTDDPEMKEYYTNFSTHHLGDSGIDLISYDECIIDPLEIATINFKIKCEMINLETNELCSYYLVPRSSISNTPFIMANSIGIIDAGYRGFIKAKIRNCSLNIENTKNHSNCLFQIISPDLKTIKIKLVDTLTITTRGTDGFGSTNK